MKRLFILFSVVISSFFIFNEDVKADITVTSSDIEKYITEDFLYKRDIVIDFAKENNYEYFIIKDGASISYYFVDIGTTVTLSSSSFKLSSFYYYILQSDNTFKLIAYYQNGSSWSVSSSLFLDMSQDLYSTNSFNIIYDNTTYVVNDTNLFMTYYDLYLLDNPIIEENPHQEEIDKIGSFYSICIDKIEYLVNEVVNNYIYLSMITIFILIFVIELTRRYLM